MTSELIESQTLDTGARGLSDVFEVAVTGIGLVTPLGVGCSTNVERLIAGDSAVKEEVLPGLESCPAIPSGRCPNFDLSALLKSPKSLKYMSRPVQLAMRAAIEAFETSRLERRQMDPFRLAIYTASGQTGLDYTEFSRALEVAWAPDHELDFRHLGGIPMKLIDPYFSLRTLANGGIGLLSAEFGAKGPSSNFVHSDTAAALALQAACLDLTEGRCDAAIVGGFDSLLYPTALFALREAGILAGDGTKFGQMIPAEGAAFFVVERHASAVARGASVLGQILGIECSLEPPVRGQSSARGIRRLIRRLPQACRSFDFAVRPAGAPLGSLQDALGVGARVSCLTRMTGSLGAATAAVELALGLLSGRQGVIPAVSPIEESGNGMAMPDAPATSIPAAEPTGMFLSGSWSGQIAAIVARSCSTEKVLATCAP
jgi:3-oxoacyl-[acyl-carrier-protein] synthase II